jgi:hypothetical protein
MITYSENVEAIGLKNFPLSHAVVRVCRSSSDVEVITPAGEFEPIITPGRSLLR